MTGGPSPTSLGEKLSVLNRQGMPAELQFEDGKLKLVGRERWRRLLDLLPRLAFHGGIMWLGLDVPFLVLTRTIMHNRFLI